MESTKQAPNDNVAYDFDADTYFKSEGMTFVKRNDDGTAHVQYEDGSEGVFDPKEFARAQGMQPSKDFDVTYNSPDAPANETPVGFVDRFKMSLGNTKGSIGYLKSKFADATVDPAGDLVVKDSGVWKRVDLAGISGDDGWKVSEILGDVADIGGDLLVGAGSLASVAATGGAAAVGLAAAGSGVASAAKSVLGRVAGTWDATPEEFMKDVLMDTAIGLVGEGVVLGAKHLVAPTLKRGFAKLSKVGEGTQDLLAKGFAAVDGENGAGSWRAVFQEEGVVEGVAEAFDEAAKRASAKGADVAAKGAFSRTQTELVGEVLYERQIEAAMPLIKNINGDLSNYFGREVKTILKETLTPDAFKQANVNLKQFGQEVLAQVDGFFNDAQLLEEVTEKVATVERNAARTVSKNGGEPVSSTVSSMQKSTTKSTVAKERVSAKSLAKWANKKGNEFVNPDDLGKLAKSLNELPAVAERLTQGVKDPKDFVELLQLSKRVRDNFDEALELLPREKREMLENLFEKRLGNLDLAVKKSLPDTFHPKYEGLRANYRTVAGNLRGLTAGLDTKNSTTIYNDVARRLVEHYRVSQFEAGTDAKAGAAQILKSLQIVNPEAALHLNNLRKANAVKTLGGASIASALSGSGALARASLVAGRKIVAPAAISVSKMQRRASLKAFLASPPGQQFMNSANVIKKGGARVAQNPELLGAGLTTMLSALQQK